MRTDEVGRWSDQDWLDFRDEQLARLNPTKRDAAVAYLRELLAEALPDLRARIAESPAHWIGGRRDAPCYCTTMEGYEDGRPWPTCFVCGGSGKGEPSLHHGWGTAVRNALRRGGFGERDLHIENLDDVYVGLVELAARE